MREVYYFGLTGLGAGGFCLGVTGLTTRGREGEGADGEATAAGDGSETSLNT